MEVEIVEFYPDFKKKDYLKGSMHVYIIDDKIDLRGWMVVRNKNTWIFHLPSKVGKDVETGELVRYPTFTYTDPEKFKSLFKAVREKGIEYITENFIKKDKTNGQANSENKKGSREGGKRHKKIA